MSESKVTCVNTPSASAIQGAWWVIAKSLSRKHNVEITPVFGDEAQKIIDSRKKKGCSDEKEREKVG